MNTHLLAYFGPETTLPIASGIMAILGFVMVMGRNSLTYLGRKIRGAFGGRGRPRRPVGARAIAKGPARDPAESPVPDRQGD